MAEYEFKKVDGKSRPVHVLLMEQMLGRPLKEDEVVHHINEDKFDNRPENLEVMTRSEHSSLHHRGQRASPETVEKLSRSHKGRANPRRALTEEQVKEVAEKIIAGCSLRVLAEEYGVSLTTICNIRDGKTCRDWLGEYPDEAFPLAEVKKIMKPNAVRRFSIEEITDIRIRLLQQESVNSIAKRYGVTGSTVMNIRDRKTYQDIPWPEAIMELHRTDNPIQLAMLMLSLPLNPEKEEFTALKEDYLIAPDWRSVNMLKLLKRALAGDTEIATLLLWLGGYGNEIDQAIAEESQIFGVFMKQALENVTKEAGAGSQIAP